MQKPTLFKIADKLVTKVGMTKMKGEKKLLMMTK